MIDGLTFRVEEDGQVRDVVVDMAGDLPDEFRLALLLIPVADRPAFLLAYRLSVPLEAAQRLVDELLIGEGVVVA